MVNWNGNLFHSWNIVNLGETHMVIWKFWNNWLVPLSCYMDLEDSQTSIAVTMLGLQITLMNWLLATWISMIMFRLCFGIRFTFIIGLLSSWIGIYFVGFLIFSVFFIISLLCLLYWGCYFNLFSKLLWVVTILGIQCETELCFVSMSLFFSKLTNYWFIISLPCIN